MILGGGKAGVRAAWKALESGAKTVYVVYRTSQEKVDISQSELQEATDKGINFMFRSALYKMFGQDQGLTHVEIARLDGKGTISSNEEIAVDTLLLGAGRFPELIYVPRTVEEAETGEVPDTPVLWETVVPYPGPAAKDEVGIFRPGEAYSDYRAVVEAIGAGRRAANSTHKFLNGEGIEAPSNMIRKYTTVLNLNQIEPIPSIPRQKMPELPIEERVLNPDAEIALGYSEEQAKEEAQRCLRCGLICYRRPEAGGQSWKVSS